VFHSVSFFGRQGRCLADAGHTHKKIKQKIFYLYMPISLPQTQAHTRTDTHKHAQTRTQLWQAAVFWDWASEGEKKKSSVYPIKIGEPKKKKKYRKNWVHLGVFLFKGQLPLSCAQVGATRSTENACHCHWSLLLQNGEYAATATAALQLIN